jgi:hypothetical protein
LHADLHAGIAGMARFDTAIQQKIC